MSSQDKDLRQKKGQTKHQLFLSVLPGGLRMRTASWSNLALRQVNVFKYQHGILNMRNQYFETFLCNNKTEMQEHYSVPILMELEDRRLQ